MVFLIVFEILMIILSIILSIDYFSNNALLKTFLILFVFIFGGSALANYFFKIGMALKKIKKSYKFCPNCGSAFENPVNHKCGSCGYEFPINEF